MWDKMKGSFPPTRLVLYASLILYCVLYIGCIKPWLHYPWGWSWLLLIMWHICFMCVRAPATHPAHNSHPPLPSPQTRMYLWSCMEVIVTPSSTIVVRGGSEPGADAEKWKEMAIQCAPKVPLRPPGAPRYCIWCEMWQPPRAQHCLLCRCCVQRQDHHSRILDRCVGQANWKPYFLFLLYGFVCCCTGAGWAMLRLLEMGHYLHVGPSDLSDDHSAFVVASLIALVVGCCFVLPMFQMTLVHMVRAALANATMAEQREVALLLSMQPGAPTLHEPWPYRRRSWIENMRDHLGARLTWWRPH